MINDVKIKILETHFDPRGSSFTENIRKHDPFFDGFGQWSESCMPTGTIKAWHIHEIQTDYWRVPIGTIRAVLCDWRQDSPTYLKIDEYILGGGRKPFIIKIPPGVAHGVKVLQGPALLTYITSHFYNPSDEGRIPYNDNVIGYDWLTEEIKSPTPS